MSNWPAPQQGGSYPAPPYPPMQSGYREGGGAVAALPLPRTGLALWTLAVVLLGSMALFAPFVAVLVAEHNPAGVIRFLKEGGLASWGLVLLHPLVTVVVTLLGVFGLRGRGAPAFVLFSLSLLPLLLSIAGATSGESLTFGAVSGESVDMGQKLRILAEGFSEANACTVLGSLSSAFIGLVAGVASLGAVIDVDTRRMAPKPSAWVVGSALGAGLALVALVVRILSPHWEGGAAAKVGFVVVVLAAALAGPVGAKIRGLDDAQDPKGVGRMAGAVLSGALLLGFVAFLFDRAAFAHVDRIILGAIAGETVDASQRVAILNRIAPGIAATRVAMMFDTGAAVLAFAPAIVGGLRRAGGAAIGPLVIGLVGVLALAGGAVSHRAKQAKILAAAQMMHAEVPSDLVPMPSDELSPRSGADSVNAIVRADGTHREIHRRGYRNYVIAPDRKARFSAVFDTVPVATDKPPPDYPLFFTQSSDGRIVLAGKADVPVKLAAELGDYAAFLGNMYLGYEVAISRALPKDVSDPLFVIQTTSGEARVATRSYERIVPLTDLARARDLVVEVAKNGDPRRLVVVPLSDANVEDVYRLIRIGRYGSRYLKMRPSAYYGDPEVDMFVTADRDAALAALQPPPPPPAVTATATTPPPKKPPTKKK